MASYIPSFYRAIFLYIDPLINLSGIYLMLSSPTSYIQNAVPSHITASLTRSKTLSSLPTNPLSNHFNHNLTTHLVHIIGYLSLSLFALQIFLLHSFKDATSGLNVKLWRVLMGAILVVDIGLLWEIYTSSPDVGRLTQTDWGNVGILGALALIRGAFLVGVGGVGKGSVVGKGGHIR